MKQNVTKKVVLEIGPKNDIVKGELLAADTGEILTTDPGKILEFIYENCKGMDIMLVYEEEQLEKASKEMAGKKYEYDKFVFELYQEAFEQLRFMPSAGIKAMIALPIVKKLAEMKEIENPNKMIKWIQEKIIPPVREILMAFLFGKQNAKDIDCIVEEARQKFLS